MKKFGIVPMTKTKVDVPNPIKRRLTNIPKDTLPSPRMTNHARAPGSKIEPSAYHGLDANAHLRMV